MKEYFYKVIIEPQPEGGYTAFVPKLPGCVSEGETYQETLDNIEVMYVPDVSAVYHQRQTHTIPDNH